MFTDDDMEIYENAVDKMVKLVNTTSSKLKQPKRMKKAKALVDLQTEGLKFTGFREKVNGFTDLPFAYIVTCNKNITDTLKFRKKNSWNIFFKARKKTNKQRRQDQDWQEHQQTNNTTAK